MDDKAAGGDHDADAARVKRGCYILGEKVPFEEDKHHEFKAHKNLSIEDISQICKDHHTRQSVSRWTGCTLSVLER